MKQYWLMKSEPQEFSMDDLVNCPNQISGWEGVRNYQARNMIRDDMKIGDGMLFYHSSCATPGIMGSAKIVTAAYPDHSAFDPHSPYFDPKSHPDNPRWWQVNIQLVKKFSHPVLLSQLRTEPLLQDMLVLRKGNRLSITPVTPKEWDIILHLAK